jgi:hypothetical protein
VCVCVFVLCVRGCAFVCVCVVCLCVVFSVFSHLLRISLCVVVAWHSGSLCLSAVCCLFSLSIYCLALSASGGASEMKAPAARRRSDPV